MSTADVTVELAGHVATVEIHRPPNNFFDTALIKAVSKKLFGGRWISTMATWPVSSTVTSGVVIGDPGIRARRH